MKTFIGMDQMAERLNDPHTVVVDCRFVMGNPTAGQEQYALGHLPGALYFDLERDLSAPVRADRHGGRHPLPDPQELAVKLGAAGIDGSKTVIAYDDQGGAMASRFWWLLTYYGHSSVSVMEEGFTRWKEAGYPVSAAAVEPVVPPAVFELQLQHHLLVSMEEVRGKLGSSSATIIDSREAPRYAGLQEPLDPIAGHIPGARNSFWKGGLTPGGKWKSAAEQRERFADDASDPLQEIIVYCGSGVTACPNVIALRDAGYTNVRLYAGSWSDWISYEGNPIATGEEDKA